MLRISDYDDHVKQSAPAGGLLRDLADYVVIGTGPAGATAAHVLSAAGYDVILIEEGRWVKPEEYRDHVFTAQKNFFRELGTVAAMGRSVMPILQGRCVGGGSVINAAIVWRLPEDLYERWERDYGIGRAFSWSELQRAFETLERDLNVKPVSPEVMGRNNALLLEGAARLGISSRVITRNERGCQGTAQCLTGCPAGAKLSTDLVYIPAALSRGSRLYAACRAYHIDVERGRARAVHADFEDPLTAEKRGRLVAHARRGVIVCASAIQSPLLLWRSGLGLSNGELGRHFQCHPGSAMVGIYPDEVRLWEGATQGWDSEHFRRSDRIKFEAISLPPELFAVRLAGVGREFKKNLAEYDRMGNVACAVIAEAEGSVRPLGSRHAAVSYSMTTADVKRLRKGLKILAEIMAAAGAEAFLPGIHGLPLRLTRDQIRLLDEAPLDPRCYTTVATHLFGTCRMGENPNTSVVNPDFELHETRGVYVLDSSVFPTNLGVNPQHTIMAVAMVAAQKIASG